MTSESEPKCPRLPYLPPDIAQPAELVAAIRARRGGELLHLDRLLLYSPPLAHGWNGFMKAVRTELTLDARLREIAICVVAMLNGAEYEFHHHAPELLRAGGTQRQVDALRDPAQAAAMSGLFSAAERAVLQFAIESTRDVAVSDSAFDAVRSALGPRPTVELVAVIGAYNMVSRFLVALGVSPEQH